MLSSGTAGGTADEAGRGACAKSKAAALLSGGGGGSSALGESKASAEGETAMASPSACDSESWLSAASDESWWPEGLGERMAARERMSADDVPLVER